MCRFENEVLQQKSEIKNKEIRERQRDKSRQPRKQAGIWARTKTLTDFQEAEIKRRTIARNEQIERERFSVARIYRPSSSDQINGKTKISRSFMIASCVRFY